MCVLTGKEIFKRRNSIFSRESWACESFQEASYDLRVDTGPVLRIGGKLYENDIKYKGTLMKIEPGEMALLPTIESFNMPWNLVGDIKIKFSHSRQGLTPLIGPKVDPFFGREHKDERLYLWVSNLGLSPITIQRGDRVFTVQFHKLYGEMPEFERKNPTADTVAQEAYAMGADQSLGFVERIRGDVSSNLSDRLSRVEQGSERVVLFGVFLVASAVLVGAFTTLFVLSPEIRFGMSGIGIRQGDILFDFLYWASTGAALSVTALAATIVFTSLSPVFKGIGNGFKWCVRKWQWNRRTRKQ